MQNLTKNWFVVSKMTRIWWILTWALEILKISTLIGSFCAKYITFDLKKSRGVIFHGTEEWCKNWKKNDLWFRKWDEEHGKFSPEHLKNLKTGTSMGSFYPMWKMYELKVYRRVVCHDNKEWCKTCRGIDFSFKNWHEEFWRIWPEHSKVSKIWTLIGSF